MSPIALDTAPLDNVESQNVTSTEPVPDGVDDTKAWRRHAGFIAWPTLLFSIVVLVAWCGIALLAWRGTLGWGLTFALQTVFAYLGFTTMHEASHGNIAGRHSHMKSVEKLLGWLSGIPLLAPYPAFRQLHLEHHRHTNDEHLDPDYWVASSSRWAVVWRCATTLPHYYCRILIGAIRAPASRDAATITALVAYVAVAVALSLHGYSTWVLAAWVGPGLVAATLLAFAFDWLPHQPHDQKERYCNSRILLFPGLGVLLTNQNFHLIHHLYPRIPFYRYGTFFDEVRQALVAKGAPIVDLASGRTKSR